MTIQGVAGDQRFCVRCGTSLVRGRCPLHGYEVGSRGAAPSGAFESPAADPAAPTGVIAPLFPDRAWRPGPVIEPASEPIWQPAPTPVNRASEEPRSPARRRSAGPNTVTWVALGMAVLLLIALIADHFVLQRAVDSNHRAAGQLNQRLGAEEAVTSALAARLGALESQAPGSAAVAKLVRASVYTIDTPDGLGSGWVASSSAGSSILITDYHVVQSVWTTSGAHTVQVKQDAKTFTGTISKVDMGDDLAAITVKQTLTALSRSSSDALVGDAVLVVGSPLGLSGTVANGIVSSFRNGLIQFSAPISPGDSGGPVVNRQGQVIGVAESKLVGSGVEGLSFAIPISTVCSTVTSC